MILLLFPVLKLSGQPVLTAGATNESLAGATAVTRDEWSLWRNPAGLTNIEGPRIASGMRKAATIEALNKSALFAINTRAGTFATGISSFGDDLYNEHLLSLAFAHKISITSVGIRADAFQLRIEDLGIRRTFGLTIGATTAIGTRIIIGVTARNINLPRWIDGQPLPVVLNAGLLFIPSDNFIVLTEIEKNTDFDPTIKAAFEYCLRKKFFVRTGFNLFPAAAFGGFGLRAWHLGLDYSLRWGYLTGYSQQISISLWSNKKAKPGRSR